MCVCVCLYLYVCVCVSVCVLEGDRGKEWGSKRGKTKYIYIYRERERERERVPNVWIRNSLGPHKLVLGWNERKQHSALRLIRHIKQIPLNVKQTSKHSEKNCTADTRRQYCKSPCIRTADIFTVFSYFFNDINLRISVNCILISLYFCDISI